MESNLKTIDLVDPVVDWLIAETNCSPHAARQAAEYVAAQQAAVQCVPTQTTVVFERFFDDTGGMQLVVHAPFGARINKAWGWAMRKRFCRSFDFELQATADDDGFILSLGPQHSFPIESLFPMLRPDNVRNLLEQALLITPTFHLRWRWNASRALQMERMRNGKKVPPALQRFRAQDLLTAVFPKLTGCQEEHTGDHEIPDHPLVQQTMHDCLHEALDIEALTELLGRVERGEITFVARDTREPSPFAYELLNANPYAFLDGGEVQERRTRMAETQRHLTVESVRDLGRLDPAAITTVVEEAQPLVRNADELHDLLQSRYLLPVEGAMDESPGTSADGDNHWSQPDRSLNPQLSTLNSLFQDLVEEGRATAVTYLDGRRGWVATERWPAIRFLFPEATCHPAVRLLDDEPLPDDPSEVRVALLRSFMETAGPVTIVEIANQTGLPDSQIDAALESLEGEGCVLRGKFRETTRGEGRASSGQSDTPASSSIDASPSTLDTPPEWCHRRLLQRIHRLTVSGLRKEIQPVDVATYFRFLVRHHGVVGDAKREGANGLYEVIGQLQGLDIPSLAWEQEVLPARVRSYSHRWLDELCLTGEVGWGRLYPPPRDPEKSRPMASITRVAPVSLYLREDLVWLAESAAPVDVDSLSSVGRQVLELLEQRGAMFATDILTAAQLLPTQLDDVLGELVTRGLATSDGFAGLRGLIRLSAEPGDESTRARGPKLVRRRRATTSTGRWSLWRESGRGSGDEGLSNSIPASLDSGPSSLDQWAWQLLRRWGVVFRDLLAKEPGAPPWWRLAPVFRRMEMRGEIRGGRFITGVGGEQYANGEAVQQLRALRRDTQLPSPPPGGEGGRRPDEGGRTAIDAPTPAVVAAPPHPGPLPRSDVAHQRRATSGGAGDVSTAKRQSSDQSAPEIVTLSAADPLNLVGIITTHARVPSLTGSRIVLLNGQPVADVQAGSVGIYPDCPEEHRAAVLAAVGSDDDTRTAEGVPTKAFASASVAESKAAAAVDEATEAPLEDRHAQRFANRKRKPPDRPRFPRPIIS